MVNDELFLKIENFQKQPVLSIKGKNREEKIKLVSRIYISGRFSIYNEQLIRRIG